MSPPFPVAAAPMTDIAMPRIVAGANRSRVISGVSSPTHSGAVLTITTLMATDVNSSEYTHVAK